ncbi:MAG TPA: transcriptional regulator [Planctomycetes bacterium]|nr:transcriptional regulator [Planctomycetota bacterium]
MELTSYIAEDLRARIAAGGELPCKVTLPALAKHYGVSLTPVRSAIARLVAGACLERLPGGRVSVIPVKRRAPRRAIRIAPPPTAPDWDRLLIQEVMLASLRREPVPLREEALARKHGVGRSVIRQSLGRLAGAGLIEHLPRRGWRVRSIREDDLTAYLEVREVLELKALGLARPHIRTADLLPMLAGNPAVAHGRPAHLDNRLHDYLIEKSGNRYIQIFFRQHIAAYFTAAFDHAAPEAHVVAEMAAQHRAILEALIARQWARARETLVEHIRAQKPVLLRILRASRPTGATSSMPVTRREDKEGGLP